MRFASGADEGARDGSSYVGTCRIVHGLSSILITIRVGRRLLTTRVIYFCTSNINTAELYGLLWAMERLAEWCMRVAGDSELSFQQQTDNNAQFWFCMIGSVRQILYAHTTWHSEHTPYIVKKLLVFILFLYKITLDLDLFFPNTSQLSLLVYIQTNFFAQFVCF